jgi:hypothetical protein
LIRADITARRAAIAARRSANAARKSAEHIPIVERAFIHGGVHPNGCKAINDGRDIEIKFSLANYGKTPGFIRYMKFGNCKLEDLPADPDLREFKEYQVLDLYFPQMKMEEVRTDTAEIVIPADGKHVVFQRVFYDDVLENRIRAALFTGCIWMTRANLEMKSSAAKRLPPTGNGIDALALSLPPVGKRDRCVSARHSDPYDRPK